jgi:hypothetical protein
MGINAVNKTSPLLHDLKSKSHPHSDGNVPFLEEDKGKDGRKAGKNLNRLRPPLSFILS